MCKCYFNFKIKFKSKSPKWKHDIIKRRGLLKQRNDNKSCLYVNKTSWCMLLSSWPAGGVAVWCLGFFSCVKMAEVDNDGEHKTSDKDDLQVLKVWIPHTYAVSSLLAFIFKMRKSRLIANLLVEVVVQLLFSLSSVTITTNTWLTSNTSCYRDVDTDVLKSLIILYYINI